MRLTGSQIVAEVLLDHGVDTVFGYPGGTALNIFDELYKYSDKIHHYLTAHEQGAAHAADGYARSTGKTGVVFATSGPGATNLVTGIATAFMDSIPLVAITANVPDSLIGRDAFQEISITGVTMPITKHNFFINNIEDLEPALRAAFQIAGSGRKGPVLVDITKDVTADSIEYTSKAPYELRKNPQPDGEVVKRIAKLINEAERPVIYFGGGVAASGAAEELNRLIEKADIPATYTLMGAGVIGYDNPHSLGMLGMHGTISANRAVSKSDLLIALGARFSDRVALNPAAFAKHAKRVQVDIDKSEIGKNVSVDEATICDVREFLNMLLPLITEKKHEVWSAQIKAWKDSEKVVRYEGEGACQLHPYDIVTKASELTDKDTI